MAVIKFFVAIFKKIKKLFTGKRGKGEESNRLPGERRIGIYGPSNVGKSVFFTMLYQACKTGRDFRLDPDDHQTGLQLVNNLNTLRSGEWLPGTVEEQELNFKAAIRGGSQFPFSTRDYKGETVDLEQEGAAKEKLIQYFQDCDAILFLLSPEMIADQRKCEREIMSFTAMINQVTESGGRGLKIPIGLMITKSDDLDGFENDKQVTLVSRKAEYLKAKDFEDFVEGICGQYHIARNIVFQEQVRDILKRLALFFDFLMTLSMEFQVFFVSSVGHVRKLEDESGQTVVRPPENPEGIGVKTPFLWVIETIRRKEKIAAMNGFRRFVFRLAVVVLIFYSIFYSWHFILHKRASLNDMLQPPNVPQTTVIQERLDAERDKWVVKNFGLFPLPGAQAAVIPDRARNLAATYAAHRYLREELAKIHGYDAVAKLATAFNTPDWKLANSWFDELIRTEGDAVTAAVESRIAMHNLQMAIDVENLLAEAQEAGASDEFNTRCAEYVGLFVSPPSPSSEYQSLLARATSVCKRIGLNANALRLSSDYDGIIEAFQQNIVRYPQPDRGEMVDLRAQAQEWATSAKRSDQATELTELVDTAELLAHVLMLMGQYLDGDERVGSELKRSNGGPLRGVRSWVNEHEKAKYDADAEGALAALKAEVLAGLDDPQASWLLGGDLASKLRGVRLGRTLQPHVDQFLANRERLRTEGAELRMQVLQAPANFVVVAWDAQEDDWGNSEGAVGVPPIAIRWIAGKKVKIGIKRVGTQGGATCDLEDYIFNLDKSPQVIPCQGTGGESTQVSFEGLSDLLDADLIAPLTSAFAQ